LNATVKARHLQGWFDLKEFLAANKDNFNRKDKDKNGFLTKEENALLCSLSLFHSFPL
jgi:hypothetical protein